MLQTMYVFVSAVLVSLLLLTAPVRAGQACRVIDGDSLACGNERIRIVGLDTAELRGRCHAEVRLARAARARMQQLVARGIVIERRGRDRYRRTLAVVRVRGGQDVADILIRQRLARAYDGRGRRRSWC